MATIKIQVKLGTYEFSAEGDEVSVRQQYAAFMEFVSNQQSLTAESTGSVGPIGGDSGSGTMDADFR